MYKSINHQYFDICLKHKVISLRIETTIFKFVFLNSVEYNIIYIYYIFTSFGKYVCFLF